MKVLHVITGLGIGGAEQQLRLLVRHLPATCEVVTLTDPGPVFDALRADGIPVTHLGMTGNRDLTALPRLTALIRAGRYDVVHTHLYRACVYGRLAARLAGVRTVVATEHSLGESQIEGRPLTRGTRALYRATERLGGGTVAVSATVARRLQEWGIPEPRVHVVPNGIDAARFRFDPAVRAATRARFGLPADAFVVGGVGRLVPGKSFDTLVRAVAAIPDAHLLLAGDGPERVVLRTLARTLGASARVHLPGAADASPAPPDSLRDASHASLPGGRPIAVPTAAPTAAQGSPLNPPQGVLPDAVPDAVPRAVPEMAALRDAAPDTPPDSRLTAPPDAVLTAPPDGVPDVAAMLAAMDVFVSVAREETFGLASVEALAAGLPVLHVTCPAIEDLPAADAPGARRIGTEPHDLVSALHAQRQADRRRLPVPAAVDRYHIAHTADRVMGLYEAAVSARQGRKK